MFNRADADGDGKMSKQEFQLVAANAPGCGTTRNGRTGCSGCSTPTGTGRSRPPSSSVWPRCAGGGPAGRPPAPGSRAPEKAPEKIADRPPTADQLAFFEKKIRPVLVEQCYECHSAEAKKVKGGLLLDTRDGIRKGGEQGPAVVPGDLEASLLIQAVRYKDENLQMPPKDKLPDEVVADFEQWVAIGRARPARRQGRRPPKRRSTSRRAGSSGRSSRRRQSTPPAVKDAAWPRSRHRPVPPGGLEAKGLQAGRRRRPRTLLRRVYFDLTGLPPTPEEVEAFVADDVARARSRRWSTGCWRRRAFGERWGRHWLDVARYAEIERQAR